MNWKLFVVAVCAAFGVSALQSVEAKTTKEIRAECRAEAGTRGGGDRTRFVKDCVAQKKAANKATKKTAKVTKTVASEKQLAQRAKMRSCSAEFRKTGKPKAERRAFMSACMKSYLNLELRRKKQV
jgi:hypothetical protein